MAELHPVHAITKAHNALEHFLRQTQLAKAICHGTYHCTQQTQKYRYGDRLIKYRLQEVH